MLTRRAENGASLAFDEISGGHELPGYRTAPLILDDGGPPHGRNHRAQNGIG
jgi:hypothetical protein